MKVPVEQARILAWCDPCPDGGGRKYHELPLDVVENRAHGERRWVMVMELVVRDDRGEFWRAFYERGLTENQDEQPFAYSGDEVEFKPVRRKVVESYTYEAIKEVV